MSLNCNINMKTNKQVFNDFLEFAASDKDSEVSVVITTQNGLVHHKDGSELVFDTKEIKGMFSVDTDDKTVTFINSEDFNTTTYKFDHFLSLGYGEEIKINADNNSFEFYDSLAEQ